MKTLQKTAVLLLLPLVYFLIASAFKPSESVKVTDASKVTSEVSMQPQTTQIPKDFTHFILNYGIQDGYHEWDNFTMFWPYYRDELHYNGIQLYDYGADTTGRFGEPLRPDQISTVNSLITGTKNRGLETIFQRQNISKLCQDGQRMVFEAEGGNDGYSYYRSQTSPIPDSGRIVVRGCVSCPPTTSAGMLCDSIPENLQFALSYTYSWTPAQDWHLKPVMRIKQSDFSANDTRPVVAIYTRNFKGDYIDTVIIRVRNFRNNSGNYLGQYINEYNFQGEFPRQDLDILGRKDTVTGLMYNYTDNIDASQIDFKIYWFGQVDVWFDKLVVDNDIADRLLVGGYDCYITDETTPQVFIYTALMIKENKFSESNYPAVNYVMNVMYNKLQNQAMPISLLRFRETESKSRFAGKNTKN